MLLLGAQILSRLRFHAVVVKQSAGLKFREKQIQVTIKILEGVWWSWVLIAHIVCPSINSQDMQDTICALLLLFVVVRGIQRLNLH